MSDQYFKNNASYLGLNREQSERHEEIMSQKMNEWDDGLKQYCQAQSRIYGFSGDALACWVADWIKLGRK